MLSSVRRKLSRKDNDPLPSSSSKGSSSNNNTPIYQPPQTAPPTRRPGNPPTMANPFRDPNEAAPPPAYTPAPNASPLTSSAPAAAASSSSTAADDAYAFLSTFDTVFLIDDSGSMAGGRWRETGDALETITPICTAHDADGIDIYFLNARQSESHQNVRSSEGVRRIFSTVRPGGATPTGQRLASILRPYVKRYETAPRNGKPKPLNLICITDGAASDDVESAIVWTARALDRLDAPAWQVGIQFFQVGRDPEAARDLAELDDELANTRGVGGEPMRDIVDTVPFVGAEGERLTGEGILKVVLGAVNRRLDRKGRGLHA